MGLLAGPLLVILVFICYVQCHRNQVTDPEVDSTNHKGLRTFDQGLRDVKDERSAQTQPTSAPDSWDFQNIWILPKAKSTRRRRRTRGSSGDKTLTWRHRFTIEENLPTSLTGDKVFILEDNTRRLQSSLRETVFKFIDPTGLRISIPVNSVDMTIVDYRIKLNDEFRGNEGGHFAIKRYKRNGMWVYEVPQLRLKQGDRVNYRMRLILGKEAFDVIVKGVMEIVRGNPHDTASNTEATPLRPTTPILAPPTQTIGGGLPPTLGGGTRDVSVSYHSFTINATYSKAMSLESANSWLQYTRRVLEKHLDFKFLKPTGLIISIPDGSMNITDFRIKLNADFRENDPGHFAPKIYKKDKIWNYDIPQLRVQQGDRVYYWMRIKQSGFNAIVGGHLEISEGTPHTDSSFVGATSTPFQYPETSHVATPYPSIEDVQKPISGVQKPISGGQKPIAVGKPATGSGQHPSDNGVQTFKWEHKSSSINLNRTSEAGLTQDSANWADKADDFFKKSLARDIKFQFRSPSGLRVLISGDDTNFRILNFNIKLNEEFKKFEVGHYQANITRTSDGKWSYYYPNLKLKQGDIVYYWFKVTFGQEMWLYLVKGLLEVSLGDPHNSLNTVRTTTPSSRPTTVVTKLPMGGGGGQGGSRPVKWKHQFSMNKTNNGSAQTSPEEEQLIKNMFDKDIDFRFLNPSGLSILFSGEDKDFRVLAFNMKVNEEFSTLGPGDYVANVTRMRDGRWNYYYPNLKVKLGDKVYYWVRVMLGKDMTDYTVKGVLTLTQGDPHAGGPVPDIPPPIIWTQAQPLPTEASSQDTTNQNNNQSFSTQAPANQNNSEAPTQVTPTQVPVPPNNNQPPTKVPMQTTTVSPSLNDTCCNIPLRETRQVHSSPIGARQPVLG